MGIENARDHLSSPGRRLAALARHLGVGDTSLVPSRGEAINPSPTAGFHGGSVFANVAQAPEDPILGVKPFFRSTCVFRSIFLAVRRFL